MEQNDNNSAPATEPATERQTPSRPERAELTVRQKIFVAAASLAGQVETFTTEDLVVKVWQLFPESFSLRGHDERHPDSNRVLAKLSGIDGLCGLGWLTHTDQRTYRVTRKGHKVARQLGALLALPAPTKPPALPERATGMVVEARPPRRRPPPRLPAEAGAPPAPPRVVLPDADVAAAVALAKVDALRKFLRGSPLRFDDACAFWRLSPLRPKRVRERLHEVEQLLRRVVESFGADGPTDPRLPPLSTCYGLLNLHLLMRSRFARELDALAGAGEGDGA